MSIRPGGDLRVLQVIQELGYGGAERVVTTLAQRVRDDGGHVSIVAAGEAAFELPDVDVAQLPLIGRRLHRVPAAVIAVVRAIRRERPHVVHAHNPVVGLVSGLATMRTRRQPGLVTVHGVPDEEYAAAARVLRLGGLPVVACGPGVAAGLEEHGLRVLETVVNGITPVPPAADPGAVKDELGLAPESHLVVSVGRLAPQKDHALALRAVACAPSVAYVVVGDGPLRAELEELARSLGLVDRVRFTGTRGDARALAGAADAFLLSSRWEGLPLVVLEALAAGTPVVATAVRGVRELLADEETALLAAEEPGALATALQRVLADDALAERLGANGRALACRYTETQMVDRYLELYRSLARL